VSVAEVGGFGMGNSGFEGEKTEIRRERLQQAGIVKI